MNPVLLIHGFKDNERKMHRLAGHLRAAGREAHTLRVQPSWGQCGLDVLAGQVAEFIERTFPAGQKIDLVGFSMGGLVCRYYLQRLGGLERVERFVSIATPHRGSWWAWLLPNAGCRQMRPGSAFLRDLASDAHRLSAIRHTSIWTPFDLMILPFTSSILPDTQCRRLWCVAHPLMVFQASAHRAVATALACEK